MEDVAVDVPAFAMYTSPAGAALLVKDPFAV
jgi:hypothetical protein